MQHDQTFTGEQLQDEVRKAMKEAGETQASVARTLGVTRSAVHLALTTDTPSRYAAMLGRIIATLTGFKIETSILYRAVRKDN